MAAGEFGAHGSVQPPPPAQMSGSRVGDVRASPGLPLAQSPGDQTKVGWGSHSCSGVQRVSRAGLEQRREALPWRKRTVEPGANG